MAAGYVLIFSVFSFLLMIVQSNSQEQLKTVQDDELMQLIRRNTYVITLFSTKDCSKCDDFESAIVSIKEELSQSFESVIVKVINSQLTRLYSPTKEPVVVFFRHGVPLLFYGEANSELILHTFLNNKEPAVKELTDETFEHLTQAATGATTGDWFIMFYTPECVDCHRLQARWEAVGSQLKNRVNVARINKATEGASTSSRFKVTQVPSFILFKQGKLYRYQIQKYDVASFLSFVKDWYKNMKPERVPLPKSPFDEFVENIANAIQENTWMWQMCLLSTIFGFLLLIFIKYKKVASEQENAKQQKKEDKDE